MSNGEFQQHSVDDEKATSYTTTTLSYSKSYSSNATDDTIFYAQVLLPSLVIPLIGVLLGVLGRCYLSRQKKKRRHLETMLSQESFKSHTLNDNDGVLFISPLADLSSLSISDSLLVTSCESSLSYAPVLESDDYNDIQSLPPMLFNSNNNLY